MRWLIAIGVCGSATAGEMANLVYTDRMYETPAGYFAQDPRDELLQELGGYALLALLEYEPAEHGARVYLPDTGTGPYGLYVHLGEGSAGELPEAWTAVFEDQHLMYCAPNDLSATWQRIQHLAFALDCVATLQARWEIDPARIVVGGFDNGAFLAVLLATHWPELFTGYVGTGRQVQWDPQPIVNGSGAYFAPQLDHLDDAEDLGRLAERTRFAFVTGEADVLDGWFSNYEGVLDSAGDWWARSLRMRVLDVPGQGHEEASAGVLDEALRWAISCEDAGTWPVRWDIDHTPPWTPIPEPEVAPPEACDPVNVAPVADAGPDLAAGVGEEVVLDGRGSFDPDDWPAALGYTWTLLSGGDGQIASPQGPITGFLPAGAGRYELELTVDDGADTATDTVIVQVIADVVDTGGDDTGVPEPRRCGCGVTATAPLGWWPALVLLGRRRRRAALR